jgi:hypothetical protein
MNEPRFYSLLLTYGVKVFFTGLLLWIGAISLIAAFRLWFDQRLVLAPFSYTRDGVKIEEAGQNFTLQVAQDLKRLSTLYTGSTNSENAEVLIGSTDQIGRGSKVELPTTETSLLSEVEVEAYGLKLSTLYKSLHHWIEKPNEIAGSVSERDKVLDVFAEIRGPVWSRRSGERSWYIMQRSQISDVSFELACSIYSALAADKTKEFADVKAGDFYTFTKAFIKYQVYRMRLTTAENEDATKALADAADLIGKLRNRRSNFAYVHKLAAYIYKEQGKRREAEFALSHYLDVVKQNGSTDGAASELLRQLREELAQAGMIAAAVAGSNSPRARFAVLQPGISIGTVTSAGEATVGTLTCLVKCRNGKVGMLSARHTFKEEGRPVVQPSVVDGGSIESNVVGVITARTELSTDAQNLAYAALAECHDSIPLSSEIFGIGPVTSVADTALVKVGDAVKIAGRTSGIRMGQVTAVRVTATIAVELSGTSLFGDLITLDGITAGGDSGAPVVTADGKLLGMVFAGSPQITYVMPVANILGALDVQLLR